MKKTIFMAAITAFAFMACSSPKPVNTIQNLKDAITGETAASTKYAAYSKKALEEGYPNIAKMFEATSTAEAIHVANHRTVLEKLGETFEVELPVVEADSTIANLKAAIVGETYEYEKMYPAFIEMTLTEKAKDANTTFTWALDAEKHHAILYKEALESLIKNGNDSLVSNKWNTCPKCGDVYNGFAIPEACMLCGNSKANFVVFE